MAPSIFDNEDYWSLYTFFNIIHYISEVFTDPLELIESSDLTFIIVYTTIALILVFQIILLIVLISNKSLVYNQYLLYIATLISYLTGSILMIPIICILMGPYSCDHFDQYECWGTLHFIYIALSCVMLIIFFIISFCSIFINFDYTILSGSKFSSIPSTYMVDFWILKLILGIYKGLLCIKPIDEEVSDTLKYFILCAICIYNKYITHYHFYGYDPQGKWLLENLASVSILSTVVILISVSFYDNYPMNGSFTWVAFTIFLVIQQYLEKWHKSNYWITSENFWKKIMGMYHLLRIKDYSREDTILIRGFVMDYLLNCKSIEVARSSSNIVNTFTNKTDSIEMQKNILIKIIEAEFDKELDKINSFAIKNNLLYESVMLAKVHYMMEVCKKTKNAMMILRTFKVQDLRLEIYYYILAKVGTNFKYNMEQKGKELSFLKLMTEENTLRELVLNESEYYYQLWDYIQSESP